MNMTNPLDGLRVNPWADLPVRPTHSHAFTDFQIGIAEALAELDSLAQYCRDTMTTDPGGALATVQDLEVQIRDCADLIRGRVAIYKQSVRKGRAA